MIFIIMENKRLIKNLLNESLTMNLLEVLVGEEYPTSFNMDVFKKLKSFNQRIKYCEENLKRISSGSSRIVYMIDNTKVLKLAKNTKGLAQNEVEIEYSQYSDLEDIVAKTFDYDNENLWVEMELARKVSLGDFKRIVGYSFEDFKTALYNYGIDSGNDRGHKMIMDKQVYQDMWENEFIYGIFDFIGNYGLPTGDLRRLNSYGIVKRDGEDRIVIIDYGFTHDVYDGYYK